MPSGKNIPASRVVTDTQDWALVPLLVTAETQQECRVPSSRPCTAAMSVELSWMVAFPNEEMGNEAEQLT